MSSSRRKLILAGALVGLVAWLGVSYWPDPAPPRAAHAADLSDADEGTSLAPQRERSAEIAPAEQALATADWPVNPFFRTPAGGQAAVGENAQKQTASGEHRGFVLNAILSGTPPLAMIDGVIVAVGDRLADGSVVTAIEARSVVLDTPQGTRVHTLSD